VHASLRTLSLEKSWKRGRGELMGAPGVPGATTAQTTERNRGRPVYPCARAVLEKYHGNHRFGFGAQKRT
jgi:hypothetical protein